MKQKILSFLKFFIPFSVLLFFIHLGINTYFLSDTDFYYSEIGIYAFLVTASFLVYISVLLVYQNFRGKTGFAFMGLGLLKMLAAILFLLPMLTSQVAEPFKNLIAFFVPYFLFLAFETAYAVKLLNTE